MDLKGLNLFWFPLKEPKGFFYKRGNSSFNNKNPSNVTPTSLCSIFQKLDMD